MALLNPHMLWGLLAIAVPVAIHFWHRKKGKTMDWAAMRWLGEQATMQHRGLRLNDILLMILRCLIVGLVAWMLSKPIADWMQEGRSGNVVHLVQPDALVTRTYRFELEGALQRGERVFWLGNGMQAVQNLADMPGQKGGDWQHHINAFGPGQKFRLYFVNQAGLIDYSKIYIPGAYQLFAAVDTARLRKPTLSNTKIRQVLVENGDATERNTITAALTALAEVHGFLFQMNTQNSPGKHYDWVFTNQPPARPQPGTQYIVSGRMPEWNAPASVTFLPDSLRLASSELVASGRFPEWLGEMLLKDGPGNAAGGYLSNGQLQTLFTHADADNRYDAAALRPWLMLVFLLLLTAERWLALRKPARNDG